MNHVHRDDEEEGRFADRVKAAVLIFLIGSIVMIADHAFVAPSEPRPAGEAVHDESGRPPSS